jgi:phosphate transport system permease protein
LANEFAEAGSGLHESALITLGLLLFGITFTVLGAARYMLSRVTKNEGTRT